MSRALQIEALWAGLRDNSGNPLSGGKVEFYEAGTSTPKKAYATYDLSDAGFVSITLDAYGRAQVFATGIYKLLVYDSDDVQIDTLDQHIYAGDAADMQFRTVALQVDDLVDGGYDVEIKPKSIHGGANNTTGHVVPNVADDVFVLLAAAQTLTNKTLAVPTIADASNIIGASETVVGVVERATDTEAKALTDTTRYLSAANLAAVNGGRLTKETEIGAWNMDTTAQVNVAHGLTSTKIRTLSAIIRQDPGGVQGLDFNSWVAGQGITQGLSYSQTNIILARASSGAFDSATYDFTGGTLDNAAAVDKGGGLVGIPITAHPFINGDVTTFAGTVNYNNTYTIVSQTTNEIVIVASFVAETFAGTETYTWSRGRIVIQYVP